MIQPNISNYVIIYHLTKSMDRIGTPSRFQSIVWTFVRHTVIIPVHFKIFRVLCFGYLFSGPLPLRSHIACIDSPPFGVCFRESLVFRLYSEIDQIHHSIEAQCGTAYLPMGDCHTSRQSVDFFRELVPHRDKLV